MRGAWGKFDRDTGTFHPLVHHCMDVAAVFSRIIRRPVVRDRLDEACNTCLDDVQRDRLSVLIFLHDIG